MLDLAVSYSSVDDPAHKTKEWGTKPNGKG